MIAFNLPNVKRVGPNRQSAPKDSTRTGLRRLLGVGLLLALVAMGCQPSPGPEETLAELPEIDEPAVQAVVSGSNQLGAGLLDYAAELSAASPNAVVSPLLLAESVALLHGSAEAETIDRLAQALGTGKRLPDEVAAVFLSRRIEYQRLPGSPYAARTSLWSVRPVFFDRAFYPALERKFSADVERAGGATKNGLRAVNRWVSEHSGGAFPAAFERLEREWILLSLSALRWEVEWKQGFDASLTQPGDFLTANGQVRAQMMRHERMPARHIASYELGGQSVEAVELPLRDGRLSLLAIRRSNPSPLPPKIGLTELEGLRQALQPGHLDIRFPKLTLASEVDLLPYLLAQPAFADGLSMHLGRLSPELTLGQHLTKMRQYASLEIAEGETPKRSPAQPQQAQIQIAFNQPFLLFLIDTQDGLVLLAGLVRDPTKM